MSIMDGLSKTPLSTLQLETLSFLFPLLRQIRKRRCVTLSGLYIRKQPFENKILDSHSLTCRHHLQPVMRALWYIDR